jgi:nitroreductase
MTLLDTTNNGITKAIYKSQHCQRNWDLSKEIPQEDLELLITAATQCPSKQNVAYYKAHFITNRDIIEAIHSQTDGFTIGFLPRKTTTNTQVLANLLVVLESYSADLESTHRNDQWDQVKKGNAGPGVMQLIERDRNMAVGVAAGYLNVTATLMGYSTGCCACFNPAGIKEILGLENDPVLLMGIGFKDPELNRRVHHNDHSFVFPTKAKQPIPTNFVK